MDKASFIRQYVIAFLGAVAAQRYLSTNYGGDGATWAWSKTQPVEDATYLAEKAWDSLQKSVPPSTPVTTGSAATVTTGTASTPTTSSTPDTADPTL